ncbi:glutamate--cysteine ligase regulatory subunit [Entomortierella parvispora]|uniref:GCS light chain n=1 Tax=Entomortierella parvispora TaxID=205924 RepID=A0A9P3H110_9FUNG|nr:glutamate--cysteine ligase regulatory subunit [Entomortierella parvispora]
MTALSSEAHPAGNGHSANGNGYHNGYTNGSTPVAVATAAPTTSAPFANDAFTHLTLYTGNTMRTGTTGQLNTSLKKSNQELVSAVQDSLLYSVNTARIKGGAITITDETSLGPLEGDRSLYEITVKMFYLSEPESGKSLDVGLLSTAIAELEAALGIADIKLDHFILSLPHQSFDENGLDDAEVEAFKTEVETAVLPVWKKLSELRQSGRIGRVGVAEFSKQQLEVLKEAALAAGAVAPEVNQVNLQDCCVLPKDLINYSKDQGIELLTHGDSTEILPKTTFSSLLQPHLPKAASTLTPNFVLKYSAFITCRGLITKKGYIVDASA